jgi:hypothetical protein
LYTNNDFFPIIFSLSSPFLVLCSSPLSLNHHHISLMFLTRWHLFNHHFLFSCLFLSEDVILIFLCTAVCLLCRWCGD